MVGGTMLKSLGKYSVIIVTTALFLALVLSVLGLNFYMSFQVEANAEAVNVAGRQRMLSQRISKSLLDTQAQINTGSSFGNSFKELKGSTTMFNTTLNAFQTGGEITGTNGQKSYLPAVKTVAGKDILIQANTLWRPFHDDIVKTINAIESSQPNIPELLNKNTDYARANINSLLTLMNDLTNEQESIANTAAKQSRIIQAFGIAAALLCFIIIMYRIFGQLRRADAQAEAAQRETQQIFNTVDQGLFLLDEQFLMGAQHSQELVNIFGDENITKRRFSHYLSNMVSASDLKNVSRYMKLLFDSHKKQKLISDLNPLSKVSVQVKKGTTIENKFLRFNFMRVYSESEVERVLASVSDITKEVQLTKDLERESKRNEQQLEMVSAMMESDRTLMPLYLENSSKALSKVNELLRSPARNTLDFKTKARSMMAVIHGVKGESSALSLDIISELCHEFEGKLNNIIELEHVNGNNFVELTVLLDKLMSYNTTLNDLFYTVVGKKSTTVSPTSLIDWGHLKSYTNDIANRQNKQVKLMLAGLDKPNLAPELVSGINSISTQLIRNAISHGIETPDERHNSNKDPEGTISIVLFETQDLGHQYFFHDDGAGIDFANITKKAIEKKLVSAEKASELTKSQLINFIFSSELSTADKTDEDKGRGIGMASVLQKVKELGGKITVKTNPIIGTSFLVKFPSKFNTKANEAA